MRILFKNHLNSVNKFAPPFFQQYSNTLTSNRHTDFLRLPESLIHGSTGTEPASHDIAQYKAIPWFMKDMDNRQLLEEWSIYVMQIPANEGRDSDARSE